MLKDMTLGIEGFSIAVVVAASRCLRRDRWIRLIEPGLGFRVDGEAQPRRNALRRRVEQRARVVGQHFDPGALAKRGLQQLLGVISLDVQEAW
jgi:hypothetical protein